MKLDLWIKVKIKRKEIEINKKKRFYLDNLIPIVFSIPNVWSFLF
jgi:hypothetical protein